MTRTPIFAPLPVPTLQPPAEGPGVREPYAPRPEGCQEDAAEDNDSFTQVTNLGANVPFTGRSCPGDPDFFELVVPDGESLSATVIPVAGVDVRIDAYLDASDEKPVATGSAGGAGLAETVKYANVSGGAQKVYLRIVGEAGRYDLTHAIAR